MRIRVLPLLLIAGLGASGAGPVAAQPAPQPPPKDVIGALLEQHVQAAPGDEDEPDTAGQPRRVLDAEPAPIAPGARQPFVPAPYAPGPRSQLGAPVHVDETGKTPDAPLTPRDLAYDTRIRSSFASAQGFQGPLDGGWTLTAEGQDLYALQLVDRTDRLEGVWRDLRRQGSINASGLVDEIQRQGSELTLRIVTSPGGPAAVATLHGGADGRWTGELSEGGARRAVTLRRTGL